ncbi:hypothetical protein Acy02nite_24250 [Actinoplanes cyaneus]|uniref:YbaB/EbfC DNA-binding family protein n=2 Tax=Actinoplanes cyaneus TaxID=52696 RepID=A0A919IF78_9ACTN|nr:hypothetical protein [Actinoplanes cyaneus]GID64544.1 hypothetical protein Acy02nite_24250 [Actinoplanes cyaneus]
MQPESIKRLHEYAESVAKLAKELSEETPQRSEGTDATGWVIVVLGRDGLPAEVRVRNGWQQRLDAEQLGAAVIESHNDALRQALRVWTRRLDDSRWWGRQRDVDAEHLHGSAELYETPPQLGTDGRAHHDFEYGERVLKDLQDAQRLTTEVPRAVEGTDDGRHVIVRLGAGAMSSCEIEPRWASRCDGTVISAALSRALERAKSQLEAKTDQLQGLDAHLGDGLATLASLAGQHRTRGDIR